MRLLLVDGSPVSTTLVKRLVPAGVEVETVDRFEEACRTLLDRAPAAVIVNLSPSALPWRELQTLCAHRDPPIPVLFESCVFRAPEEAGLAALSDGSGFLRIPCPVEEQREQIQRLVRAAGAEH